VPSEESWGDEWPDEEEPGRFRRQALPTPTPTPTPSPVKDPLAPPVPEPDPEARELDPLPVAPTQRFADLDLRWAERRYALMRRDAVESAAQEARLLELMQVLDVREVDTFAAAAVRETVSLTWSDPRLALARADLAVALAPSLPTTHRARAAARFAVDPWGIFGWGSALLDSLVATLTHERHLRPLLADLGMALGLAISLAGAFFLCLLALRYGRYVLHDFHHLFPKRTARLQTTVLAVLILSLPLALGFGPVPLAILSAAMLWLYMGRAEQIVTACWLVSLGILPIAAGGLASRTAWSGTTADVLDRIDRSGDLSLLPMLEERSRRGRATVEELFVLARTKKREGGWDEAATLYERILEQRQGWAPAEVNLGNVRFLQGDLAAAESHYRRAIANEPSKAAAWFDLSRVHYRRVEFVEGQQARERAIDLDPTLVERYADGDQAVGDANRYLVDARLDDAELAKVAVHEGEGARVARQVAALLNPRLPPALSPWLPLVVVALLAAALRLRERLRPAFACSRCGRAVCSRCDPETRNLRDCGQCLHVFGRRTRVDPAARVRKERSVRRYKGRRRLVLGVASLFLAAPVLSGRTVRGVAYVVAAFFFAALLLLGEGVLRRTFGDPGLLRPVVVSVFLAAIYFQGLRSGLRDQG